MEPDDILIFVEDPGAAQCIVGLPQTLAERGLSSRIMAAGIARQWLMDRGVAFTAWTEHQAEAMPDFGVMLVGTAENVRTPGLALIDEARRRGRPSVAVVDAAMNASWRFRGESDNPVCHAPDYVLVPDPETARVFTCLGLPSECILPCGHPHYDFVLQAGERLSQEGRQAVRRRIIPGAREHSKLALYVCEGAAGTEKGQTAYTVPSLRDGRFLGRTEAGLELFLEALSRIPSRPLAMVRPHPKDSPEAYSAFASELDSMAAVGDPLEAVFAADVVVGQTSMLLTEAALLGRPVISLPARPEEAAWLPPVRAGAATVATSVAEAASALEAALSGSTPKAAFNPPRGALGRVVDILAKLAGGQQP